MAPEEGQWCDWDRLHVDTYPTIGVGCVDGSGGAR
jgi:hypothetical protein